MARRKAATGDRRRRRQKSTRRMLLRFVTVVLIAVLVYVAWTNWDTLAPDKLIAKWQDSFAGGAGSYPVDIAGSNARRLVSCQRYTALLTESHLTFYDSDGGEMTRYASPSSNALLRQAGKYVLLAEQGGRRLQLLARTGMVTEVTAEYDILSAAVNAKGQMAVLTHGPQGYEVQVSVYSPKGKRLYTRSRNHTAIEVALSADGSQVAMLSVRAENGDLNTAIHVFDTRSAAQEAKCTYETDDVLLYRLEYLADAWLAAVGEDGVVMLDTGDGLATVFTLGDHRLLGYAAADHTMALVTRDYGNTGAGQVQVIDKKGEPLCTVDFAGDFRHLSADSRHYLLLTDDTVTKITPEGAAGTAASAADGQQAVLSGNRAVVMGLNTLQAYELK